MSVLWLPERPAEQPCARECDCPACESLGQAGLACAGLVVGVVVIVLLMVVC